MIATEPYWNKIIKTTPITSMMSIELHLKKDCCVYPIA